MTDLAICRAVVERFENEHPDVVRSISHIINLQEDWPCKETWEPYYVPGVYIMLNERESVIYVGKSVAPATRMESHFRYDSATNILETKHSWKEKPVSVVIVTSADEPGARFLERYLIFKLNPPYNSD
jgi:GIY-YIG catalytic domain-containing protein